MRIIKVKNYDEVSVKTKFDFRTGKFKTGCGFRTCYRWFTCGGI